MWSRVVPLLATAQHAAQDVPDHPGVGIIHVRRPSLRVIGSGSSLGWSSAGSLLLCSRSGGSFASALTGWLLSALKVCLSNVVSTFCEINLLSACPACTFLQLRGLLRGGSTRLHLVNDFLAPFHSWCSGIDWGLHRAWVWLL